MEDILVPIAFFSMIAGIVIVYFITRKKERLAMIEKGFDPSLFGRERSGRMTALKWGLVAIGVGIGLLTGTALKTNLGDIAIPAMVAFCAGAMLTLYYLITKWMGKEE